MKKIKKFENYAKSYFNIICEVKGIENLLKKIKIFKKKNKGKIILLGNGGSSSISGHIAIDFLKANKIRAISMNDHNLITCFANDFGFENWMQKSLEAYTDYKEDLVILISSSGNSKNLINAAKFCNKKNIELVTLTGFNKNNLLSKYGDLNLWVNSKRYNFVEVAHLQILTFVVDNL